MRRIIALWLLLWSGSAPAQEQSPEIFKEIDEILAELAGMTGLKAPKKVHSDSISKADLKGFLDARMKEVVKPEEIRAEEITLKKFGLAPADFDLRKMTIDLLTEQAAAFYDYRKKKLFLLDSNMSLLQRPVLVHELAHALADSHFNLEKYIFKGKSDDSAVARQAVMEGQATWLMSEWVVKQMGTSLRKAPDMVDTMNRMSSASGGAYPVFDSAPLYLKESLLFPYSKGFLFQHEVIVKLGEAGFAEVFRNPPVSSQQIIHPEKYFAKVRPTDPPLPNVNLRGYKELVSGGFGEFDHEVLLRQYVGEKESRLAWAWRGARFRILENKKEKRFVLVYVSEWESEPLARRMFGYYRKVLAGKWKQLEITRETDTELRGRGDDGYFHTRLEGPRLISVEGLAAESR